MTPPVVFNSFPLPVTHLTAVEPPRDRRRVAILLFRDWTAVVLRRYGGDGCASAVMEVLLRSLYGATAVMAVPRRPHCGLDQLPVALWKFWTTADPRRSRRCHCGLRRTSTAVAPCLRCDDGSTAEARRNMFKVSAALPQRSAVLTLFRGATAINDGTTAKPRRSWRCHCGLCRTSTAVAPRLRCDGGIRV